MQELFAVHRGRVLTCNPKCFLSEQMSDVSVNGEEDIGETLSRVSQLRVRGGVGDEEASPYDDDLWMLTNLLKDESHLPKSEEFSLFKLQLSEMSLTQD